ncbi:helix-turn-helix domain-containing protein [Teichococcus vastitatis]|uniref:helix-turn-helix domain-containing protein n=1 Tax=Teichococcus vastitatis TaxID=2307076 RepID=UPI000E770022|nr:helix-turn-helix transcriptional regulator [Pseudoroseomonas vastitatis]
MINTERPTAGTLLRHWRRQRRLSQMALALEAGISQRHLSCLEAERARPSRAMVLHLTEQLRVPLRERNAILVAAGFAPVFRERPLQAPELAAARQAMERILHGHSPHPALAVDRHWNLISANEAVFALLGGMSGPLMQPPVNVLRLSLHPEGLAPRILNFAEWRAHLLARLAHEVQASADAVLLRLLEELKAYAWPPQERGTRATPPGEASIAVPLRLAGADGPLSFLSTTTVFGTAVDVTLAEVTIETFFPADEATGLAMTRLIKGVEVNQLR